MTFQKSQLMQALSCSLDQSAVGTATAQLLRRHCFDCQLLTFSLAAECLLFQLTVTAQRERAGRTRAKTPTTDDSIMLKIRNVKSDN